MAKNDFRRALMLDIGRKYFSPEVIKDILGTMAQVGMNALSLHFSEDMGLGIECPAYPFLAGRDGGLCPYGVPGTVHPIESYLTVEELRGIVTYAASLGIEVIPSYDSPGHLNYTVKKLHEKVMREGSFSFGRGADVYRIAHTDGYFEFFKNGEPLNYPRETSGVYGVSSFYTYKGRTGRVKGTNAPDYSRGIDLSNEAAVAFVRSILDSYALLFRSLGCRTIDVGGDELLGYSPAVEDTAVVPKWRQLESWEAEAKRRTGLDTAVAYDLFMLYQNENCRRMRELGYEDVLVWNDEFMLSYGTGWTPEPGKHILPAPDVTVQYWSASDIFASPAELARRGYPLIGALSSYTYYVLIEDARCDPPKHYTRVNPECLRNEWDPFVFGIPAKDEAAQDWDLRRSGLSEKLTGSMFCVWCDHPVLRTDRQVAEELKPLLAAWSEKLDKTV